MDCLWGGNSYDQAIADIYDVPIIGFILSSPDPQTINIDLYISFPSYIINNPSSTSTTSTSTLPLSSPSQEEAYIYLNNYRGKVGSYLAYDIGSHYDYIKLS